MKKCDIITPEGTRDLLFAECELRREFEGKVRKEFEKKGYREVMTPGIEFYDVFSMNEAYFPQESMYKSVDNKGRLLVNRPDSTIPIARLTATKLKGYELPIRLYYAQKVYRQQQRFKGRSNEIMQMGVEHIGSASFESDLEILSLGIKSLASCGFSNYRIEIGHIGIFKLLMKNLNVRDEDSLRIHGLIVSKNYAALEDEFVDYGEKREAEILKALPKLFGGSEVLKEARELFKNYDSDLDEMLDYLENILKGLEEKGLSDSVIIDFGLVNQADYYTSLIFRGYISSVGEPVLSGGRYDNLFKDFGEDLPATGFALNMDKIVDLFANQNDRTEKNAKCLRIALTKGRLEKSIVKMLESKGYDTKNLQEKGRKLILPIPGTNIEVVLAKAPDVITYIENGVCDIGIVGKDTIMESGGTFYEVLDLGFGKCKFALAGEKGKDFYSGYKTKRIATKYPNVAKSHFEKKGMDIEVIKIEGSVELAPLLDLADGIVDIVETGSTLKENGLEVIEDVREVSARLIVNIASMKMKKKDIDSFIKAIQ